MKNTTTHTRGSNATVGGGDHYKITGRYMTFRGELRQQSTATDRGEANRIIKSYLFRGCYRVDCTARLD